ncbi:MAG: aminotransferase class I/II-fold pyridoxal phosphate-dependent enzyme [Burkholderiales bacterium]|nr:aminotransferase class I/II-fold pyridoxal phosphate-dependent enzyme [Burkholderiales bacterium]
MIHLEIGEPDFTAPPAVVEAAVRALREGRTAYTPTLGLPALREAIAAHYARVHGAAPPSERVAVTAGASAGLLLALALYVEPGDEILVPDPGYPGYRHLVRALEGRARALAVSAATNWQPTPEIIASAWTPRTKGVLLGSPSNPTGTRLARADLARIAEVVAARGGVLIVDEIYRELVYGAPPQSALGLPGEVVLVDSFSKFFCMTGWRLGWVVLPEAPGNARVRDLEKLAQHVFICAPALAQHAALACFLPETLAELERRRREFERRRDFLLPALARAGLEIPSTPTGAFYVYARCPGGDGRRYAMELLEREAVAATPGVDFGANGTAACVRFAYARPLAELEEAAQRLARFAS